MEGRGRSPQGRSMVVCDMLECTRPQLAAAARGRVLVAPSCSPGSGFECRARQQCAEAVPLAFELVRCISAQFASRNITWVV